jgi:hypothetical protein
METYELDFNCILILFNVLHDAMKNNSTNIKLLSHMLFLNENKFTKIIELLIDDDISVDSKIKVYEQNKRNLDSVLSGFCHNQNNTLKDIINSYLGEIDDNSLNLTSNEFLKQCNSVKILNDTLEFYSNTCYHNFHEFI